MSRSHASQLLSKSYDRKLTDEEILTLDSACAVEPELLECRNVLDRLRQFRHADDYELERDSLAFPRAPLSDDRKLEIELLIQSELHIETPPVFDHGELFWFLSDCSMRQVAGNVIEVQEESLACVKQLLQTNDCTEVESVGFYAQKTAIEDIPDRVLTAVVCASPTAMTIEN